MTITLTIPATLQAALTHHQAGRLPEAEALYRQVLAAEPGHAGALNMLGVLAHQSGQSDLAVELIKRAIEVDPASAEACNNLGNVLREQGRAEEAVTYYERALAIAPNNPDAHNNLGIVMQQSGRIDEAIACYRRALEINPGYAVAHNNLGFVLQKQGHLDEAIAHLTQAIVLRPNYAIAHSNLGIVLKKQGKLGEALVHYREAIRLRPNFADAHSDLLLTLSYGYDYEPEAVFAEHLEFARRHAAPLAASIRPHTNDRSGERRLRIGYVSGDFRGHAVAHFIEPVLANHDRGSFEIFCYYNNALTDEVTGRLRRYANHWRDIAGMPDEAVAQQIRADGIDILVDLSGHTRNNRLLVFARKPAPVQVTWLGYLNTTGLSTMDYRLSDVHASPPGMMDKYHTEELIRLPDSQWCYQPPQACPEVGELPALESGGLTFASFHSISKLWPAVLNLWAEVLHAVPNSRLILVGSGVEQKAEIWGTHFAQRGIDLRRLEFLGVQPFDRYLALHQRVDVNLDAFPYPGGTTTCHSLWMGVPVITLAGTSVISRGGVSLLSVVGLPEFIAHTPEEYVEIAVKLAADVERLKVLRAGLRERMAASPLMHAARFTRHLEAAYRQMWRRWCASGS